MQGAQNYLPPANLEQHIPNRQPKIAGTDLTNLLSWMGLREGDQLPPFWELFLNAPSDTNHTDILCSLLLEAQQHNVRMQFSIRPDLICDLKGLKYHQLNDTKCPMWGITPLLSSNCQTWNFENSSERKRQRPKLPTKPCRTAYAATKKYFSQLPNPLCSWKSWPCFELSPTSCLVNDLHFTWMPMTYTALHSCITRKAACSLLSKMPSPTGSPTSCGQ